MAYVIKRSDLTLSPASDIVIANETIDTSTSLKLMGRNVTDFGEHLGNNVLHLLENFANTIAPTNALPGQLWFDTTPGDGNGGGLKVNLVEKGDAGPNWQIMLTSTAALQDELNDLETVLGDMITQAATYDPQAFIGFSHITNDTGNANLYITLQQLDGAISDQADIATSGRAAIDETLTQLIDSLGPPYTDGPTGGDGNIYSDSNLDQLEHISGNPDPIITLYDAFVNIDASFTATKALIGVGPAEFQDTLINIDQIEDILGLVKPDGHMDYDAVNDLLFYVSIGEDGTVLDIFNQIDTQLIALHEFAADDSRLSTLYDKVTNMETIALGPMVLGDGTYDKTVFSETAFLGSSESVQTALVNIDTVLSNLTAGIDGVDPGLIDAIVASLGILETNGDLKVSAFAPMTNMNPSTTFTEALQDMDDAVELMKTNAFTSAEATTTHPERTEFEYSSNSSGAFVKIPLDLASNKTLLIQWGRATQENVVVTFPTSYLDLSYSIVLTPTRGAGSYDSVSHTGTSSSFKYSTSSNAPIAWITVGVI